MKKLLFIILMALLYTAGHAQTMPDTTGGTAGWRVATQADAAYWPNVSVGDVILFGKLQTFSDSAGVYIDPKAGYPTVNIRVIYSNYARIPISGGQKIHIWRGNYGHIDIFGPQSSTSGGFVESNSSEQNPVIITNLGGQVVFGRYGTFGGNFNKYVFSGSFAVSRFNYVLVTGEYDAVAKTGDSQFPGMNGNLSTAGWINKFGIMGDRKYTTLLQGRSDNGLGFVGRSFLSMKVRGIAVVRGFFAGFSVKSDNLTWGDHTKIDIQKCLSGWHEGEGFYVGNTDGKANEVNDNIVIFKNNVALFTGAEGIQIDKVRSTSEVKNNFMYKTACFYQRPFQGSQYQEKGFQPSFVEGNVAIQNNVFYSGNAGTITNGWVIASKSSATVTSSNIVASNNLFGPSRIGFGTMQVSSGDAGGLIKYYLVNNIIDSITVPETNDAYTSVTNPSGYIDIQDNVHQISLAGNIYPYGLKLYSRSSSAPVPDVTNARQQRAAHLLLNDLFGFEPLQILSFRGVWYNGLYGSQVTASGPITYNVGDVVFTISGGTTRYYKCIQGHSSPQNPVTQTAYWQKLTWNGQDEPVYTPLLKADSYYNYKGIGLTYNPANVSAIDTIAPVITAQQLRTFRVGDTYVFPAYSASDNKDGNITTRVKYFWKNGSAPQVNASNQLTAHGQYELVLNAEDNAGNRADLFTIKVVVSDATVTLTKRSQLNFHTNSRANLLTNTDYWTDFGENTQGLVDATSTTPIVVNTSILKDTTGALVPWTVRVDDYYNSGGYSQFYGTYDNGTGAIAVQDFPAPIIKEGLRLREGLEVECHIIFRNLDPAKYYDFRFTGYKPGSGEVSISLTDSVSGQSLTFNVINNSQAYELTNLRPTAGGTITIINKMVNVVGQTGRGESHLAGFVITEKQGFGYIGSSPVTPSKVAQINISFTGSPVTTAGDYWNAWVVTNSNTTFTLSNVKQKDGSTIWPISLSVVRSSTEGFNYALNGNTGITTGNNSGIVPDPVLQNSAGLNSSPAHIYISGLDPAKLYAIQTLSNGPSNWDGQNYTVGITVQGAKQVQNFAPTGGNTTSLLAWSNVAPDATGKILVTVANENNIYGSLNALIITEGGTPAPRREAAAASMSVIEPEMGAEAVSVYPVPAKDVVQVKILKQDFGAIRKVKVVDAFGRTQKAKVIGMEGDVLSLDVSDLQGFYILVVEPEEGKAVYKDFIVE